MKGRHAVVCALALALLLVPVAVVTRSQSPPQGAQTVAKTEAGVLHPELPDTKADTCLTCHDTIGKAAVIHGPVSGGYCTSCHVFSGAGDKTRIDLAGGATKDNTAALCGACHDDVLKISRAEYAHGPVAEGNCISCHDPHSSEHPYVLKLPEAELCSACHDDVGLELKMPVRHAPAAAACSLCHDPHGNQQPARLREPVNKLCLACHNVRVRSSPSDTTPTLFGRDVPEKLAVLRSPSSRVALDPLGRLGHPIAGHPVEGPNNLLDVPGPLTCISCHTPHGSKASRLLRFGDDDGTGFCVKCHK